MLQPIHVLRLSVAVVAVAVGALWIKSLGVGDDAPRVSTRWRKLEIEDRDGVPDLARVGFLLSRHGGSGMAPWYQVAITGTGGAAYRGERCVKLAGPVAFEIDRDEVADVLDAFDHIDFMKLTQRDVRFDGDTHGCRFTITMRIGGRRHSVTCLGGATRAERSTTAGIDVEGVLTEIAGRIDAICSIERYIGTETERGRLDLFDVPEKYRMPSRR